MPGITGTPAAFMSRRASVFEPRARMAALVGPMKVTPARSQASAKSPFSARKPYPGWMASAPLVRATSRILSCRR